MLIALAEEHDLKAILENMQASNQKLLSQGIYQWDDTYPSRALLEADVQQRSMYVALEHSRVIASVSVDTKQPSAYANISWHPTTVKPLLIHRLCVTPEKQGQGIGQKMLEFIEAYAKEQKHDCLRVDVHANNKAALAIYEKRAFKRLGEIFFPRREAPFICMEKIFVSS